MSTSALWSCKLSIQISCCQILKCRLPLPKTRKRYRMSCNRNFTTTQLQLLLETNVQLQSAQKAVVTRNHSLRQKCKKNALFYTGFHHIHKTRKLTGSSCRWKGEFIKFLHSEVGLCMVPDHALSHHGRATYNAGRTLLLCMPELPTGKHYIRFGMYDHTL
jgi:hypothetical protein